MIPACRTFAGLPGALRRVGILAGLALLAPIGALAGDIDLSKPWGNKDGCANRIQQEYYSDDMVLLTADALVTGVSACAFSGKKRMADGSLHVTATCEEEGNEGTTAYGFTIRHQSPENAEMLVIADDDGNVFGEVSQCQ